MDWRLRHLLMEMHQNIWRAPDTKYMCGHDKSPTSRSRFCQVVCMQVNARQVWVIGSQREELAWLKSPLASGKSRKFLNSLEHLKWLRTLSIALKLVLFLLNFPFKAIKGVLSHLSHLRIFSTFLMCVTSYKSFRFTKRLWTRLLGSASDDV